MKTHMLKYPPEHMSPSRLLHGVALLLSLACASVGGLGNRLGSHPASLAREWMDSSKTTESDTSLWVLASSGDDGVMHIRAGGTESRHYGYWYVHGSLASDDHALCFTNRPGRSAPTCRPFDLDSIATLQGFRRRLVIRGYRGAHSSSDRVLLERR